MTEKTDFVNAQTSVPYWLMVDFHQVAVVKYGRLNRMYIHMLQGFLAYEPWKANPPLQWRSARIHGSASSNVRQGADLGWVPMNMLLPVGLVEKIKHTIDVINVSGTGPEKKLSLRSFLYTAVLWWYSDVLQFKARASLD